MPVEYFSELIDCIDDFIFLADEELRIIKANRAASLHLGFPDRELESMRLGEIINPRERKSTLRLLKRLQGRRGGETVLRTKSRLALSVECSVSRLAGIRGSPSGYLFVCRPMTASPEGTRELRKRILDSISQPLFVISFPARTIIECNQCATALSGFESPELIGRSMFDFMTFGEKSEGAAAKIARVNDSYAGMGYFQSRIFLSRKRGPPLPCDCFSIPYFKDTGHADFTILALIDRSEEEGHRMQLDDLVARSERLASDLAALAAREAACPGERKRMSLMGFTPRHIEIARLVSEGFPSKEIGGKLGISESTVKNHLAAMFRKIGATSRVDFLHRLSEDRIWIA